MITRNTKLYKINFNQNNKKEEAYYRDLSVLEMSFLSNIKNDAIRCEMAANLAIYERDPSDIPIGVKLQIGREVLTKDSEILSSKQLFEITISELRDKLKNDDYMIAIKYILATIPGQSFTDLIKLNLKDILELVCLCESITGKPIFDTKKRGLVNTKNLPDDGKSLQEKMNELNSFVPR